MSQLSSLLSNPFLGLKDQNGYSRGYRPDMNIPCTDSESPWQTSLGSSSTKPIGEGHLTPSPRSQIILAVSRATGQVLKFCVWILVLLKKWDGFRHSLNECNWRRLSNLPFSIHHWFCYIWTHSWNFKFPSSDSQSSWNLGLEPLSMKWIGESHSTFSSCLNHWCCHIGTHSENFKFPSPDSESPPNLGLEPLWTKSIGEGHPTCSSCPKHYFGYSRCHRHNQVFSWPDSQSPQKTDLGTCWTIQFGAG